MTWQHYHKAGRNYFVGDAVCLLCQRQMDHCIFTVVENINGQPQVYLYCADHLAKGLSSHLYVTQISSSIVVDDVPNGATPIFFRISPPKTANRLISTCRQPCKIIYRGVHIENRPKITFRGAQMGISKKQIQEEDVAVGVVKQIMAGRRPRR